MLRKSAVCKHSVISDWNDFVGSDGIGVVFLPMLVDLSTVLCSTACDRSGHMGFCHTVMLLSHLMIKHRAAG
jgi:hypothetical protein